MAAAAGYRVLAAEGKASVPGGPTWNEGMMILKRRPQPEWGLHGYCQEQGHAWETPQ